MSCHMSCMYVYTFMYVCICTYMYVMYIHVPHMYVWNYFLWATVWAMGATRLRIVY